MKRTVIFALMILLTTVQASTANQKLEHPPLPTDSPQEERVAIVLLEEKKSQQEIHRMVKAHPQLVLRHIFTEALNGFSVKGSIAALEKLAQTNMIEAVEHVQTYRVSSNENIDIIGGNAVRGKFDESNQRLTGKGVTVGVIDTGIDYRHPDLRRSYGGGHDLVDGDQDPMETRGSHGQGTLHGTHVAGIIAANGKIRGVAPEAKIIAYRALGPGGLGTTEQVIAAIDQAMKDQVDILNLSLGNNINGPDLPISKALNRAVEKGITAVTSSGNSGPNVWTVGSPGTASKAISVGASTPPMKIPYLISGDEKIRLEPMQGSDTFDLDRGYELVFGGIGKQEEIKNAEGKIVLVERGEIVFAEKAKNAHLAGAVAVLIYNNIDGGFIGNLDEEVLIPVATISKKDGEQLLKKIKRGKQLFRTNIIEEKDTLADFSSRGPVTSTWEIKPDVVAPGVAINSTIPGGYLPLQGTSMAAPHVAGACALLKQAHPDWGPQEMKAALMNTAKPMVNESGHLYRAYEQGAGRIQMEEAIEAEALVMPGSLHFGKFRRIDRQHEHRAVVTVKNVSETTKTFSFTIPNKEKGINWIIPMSFTLKPGAKKKVDVTMSVDPTLFKKKLHDGALELHVGVQTIRIPYLYVLEEPDYPRVMGFGFGAGDQNGSYRYEVYLPGGADEFGIALFDPDHYQFVTYLDWKRQVHKGMLKQEIEKDKLPKPGVYLAKVFAKKHGREDMVETLLYINVPREAVLEKRAK
jgi:minor extracellular serine protease Vpr